jgi:hypothetical protein
MLQRKVTLIGLLVLFGFAAPSAHALTATPQCSFSTSAVTVGTPVLHHPTITLIFWGSLWSTQAPSMGTFVGQAQSLVNGPYFSALNQYGGINQPRIVSTGPFYTKTSPARTFTDAQLISVITAEIQAGLVPTPNASAENIYVVVTQSETQDSDHTDGQGYHDHATYNGVTFPWAWIGDPSGDSDQRPL